MALTLCKCHFYVLYNLLLYQNLLDCVSSFGHQIYFQFFAIVNNSIGSLNFCTRFKIIFLKVDFYDWIINYTY